MAINDYTKEPRKDGYRGFRVYHSVNGKLIQKYFHWRNRDEAIAYNKALIAAHDHRGADSAKRYSQQYQYSAKRYDPPKRTEVVGITMAFQYQKRCVNNLWYPTFVLGYQNKKTNIKHHTSRKISVNRNLEDTWRESCQVLARWREYKRVPRGWYDKCPTAEDFNQLRLWYCANGTDIPIHNMHVFDLTYA